MKAPTIVQVDADSDGQTLAAIVRRALDNLPWSRARDLCTSGRVRLDGKAQTDSSLRVRSGCTIEIFQDGPRIRSGTLPPEAIVYVDRDVVVVNKPKDCMTLPFDGERDTLVDQTRATLRKTSRGYDPMLGVVHRLDKDTTGLLVFARTMHAKKELEQQFRKHSVTRLYWALVHGDAKDATYETLLVRDRGDGLRGSWDTFRPARGNPPNDAQKAVTHVSVSWRSPKASLVQCRLETGRQHQIRIHLSEAGHPLVGERVYVRGFSGKLINAPRPMLHAAVLGFVHPRTERDMHFEEPVPEDFDTILSSLKTAR